MWGSSCGGKGLSIFILILEPFFPTSKGVKNKGIELIILRFPSGE